MQAIVTRILAAVSGNPLLERLLVASVELVVVTCVVLAIIHVARVRSSRVIALMWLIALCKPLLGLALGTPAPVFGLERPAVTANSTRVAPAVPPPPGVSVAAPAGDTGTPRGGIAATEPAVRSARRSPVQTLLAVWLTGAGLLLLLSVLDRLRIRNIVATSTAPDAGLEALYLEAAGTGPFKKLPVLRITDRLESPAIAGSFRPVIFLPGWMTRTPDRDRILWSLRHELTHWRHGDTVAGFVREIARALFFFHPLVWWIGRQWKEASEVACDQAMVGTRSDARRYAEQLYQILRRVHTRRQIMITSGLFATRTQIGKRIELLLKNRTPGGRVRTLPAAAFLLVFAGLVLSLGAEISPQAEPHDIYIKSGGDDDRTVTATVTETGDDGTLTITLTTKGRVRFNSRKTDVRSISDGGRFELKTVRDGESRELVITPGDDGELEREYRVNDDTRDFDDDARDWLADCLDHVEDGDYGNHVLVTRPHVMLRNQLHAGAVPRIAVEIAEPDGPAGVPQIKVLSEDRRVIAVGGDDDVKTIDLYISGEEDDGDYIWTFKRDGDVLRGKDGHFVLNLTPGGKVIITIDRDGDTHQLEVRPGKRGERDYIYKVNGEKKPYDGEARELFEKYIDVLDGGLEIHRGEKI